MGNIPVAAAAAMTALKPAAFESAEASSQPEDEQDVEREVTPQAFQDPIGAELPGETIYASMSAVDTLKDKEQDSSHATQSAQGTANSIMRRQILHNGAVDGSVF